MPQDIDGAEQELERRLAGTGLDWEHDFQNFYRIRVSSEVLGEEELLESSARKLYALFHDLCNPELDELPYPRTAHELIKYYDKQRRRPPGSPKPIAKVVMEFRHRFNVEISVASVRGYGQSSNLLEESS